LFGFNVRRRARHHVTGDTAQNVGLIGRKVGLQISDEIPRNRGERVSVVKAKWHQAVTLVTNLKRVS
jgi:hypothetical protein